MARKGIIDLYDLLERGPRRGKRAPIRLQRELYEKLEVWVAACVIARLSPSPRLLFF